ncbi:MAG: dihydropteroate synthase [Spirochaetaceae bacterium]|nr:MAG: dihydropteroate synthase [Spirochaetaceae bacterium]
MTIIPLPRMRTLPIGPVPLVMGILNCTPDSFYPGGRAESCAVAVKQAREMISSGADILDIGGESSRPGSASVSLSTELDRVLPVLEEIRTFSDIPISVDTRKSEVARRALLAGADIINDISALHEDPEKADIAAEHGAALVLMHMRGTPATMQVAPFYEDPVGEILEELEAAVEVACKAGVPMNSIILDPGIGFAKRLQDNIAVLRGIPRLRASGFPILIGHSRKSFLGALLADEHGQARPVEARLAGGLAVSLHAASHGAEILRVHDVAETVDALRVGLFLSSPGESDR